MQLEIHILQSFPPANLNRDENGMPKSTVFGGRPRARISSQCQKRAARLYYHEHAEELGIDVANFAERSRGWATKLKESLIQQNIVDSKADLVASLALTVLTEKKDIKGKQKTKKSTSTKPQAEEASEEPSDKVEKSDTILFLGNTEVQNISTLLINNWAEIEKTIEGKDPALSKDIVDGIINTVKSKSTPKPGDVALFGRMMANLPNANVDAAVQMAHAISVNTLQQEFDFFTAVDDLSASDDQGADHIGETGFNSSTFYRFANVDTRQLTQNLGTQKGALAVTQAFVKAFIRAIPTGHQNGFAAHSLPALVLLVVREGQPVSLVDAFEDPIRPGNGMSLLEKSVQELDLHWADMVKMYGDANLKYCGVTARSRLDKNLRTLTSNQVDSVDALVDAAITAAFPN